MPFRSVFYLRLIPTRPLAMPLPLSLLLDHAGRYGAFGAKAGVYIRENEYGVAIINPAGDTANIDSLTQHFRNGEIWGINADILRQGDRGEPPPWLISMGIERTLIESLGLYFDFVRDVSRIEPPFTIEAGLHRVRGRLLVITGATLGASGKIFDDSFELRRVIRGVDQNTQHRFLLEFFELMHGQTGHPRPNKLYGFPPN